MREIDPFSSSLSDQLVSEVRITTLFDDNESNELKKSNLKLND